MKCYKYLYFFLSIIFKDLTSVQNLQKKHTLLEADVASHQDRIEGVKITADQFVDGGHFDSDNIRAKQVCSQTVFNLPR